MEHDFEIDSFLKVKKEFVEQKVILLQNQYQADHSVVKKERSQYEDIHYSCRLRVHKVYLSDPKYSYILIEVKNMDPVTPENS